MTMVKMKKEDEISNDPEQLTQSHLLKHTFFLFINLVIEYIVGNVVAVHVQILFLLVF
jgi:hypothetical protein